MAYYQLTIVSRVSEIADDSRSRRYNSRQEEEKENKASIMLIDDEPDALLTYKTFLSSEGYATYRRLRSDKDNKFTIALYKVALVIMALLFSSSLQIHGLYAKFLLDTILKSKRLHFYLKSWHIPQSVPQMWVKNSCITMFPTSLYTLGL